MLGEIFGGKCPSCGGSCGVKEPLCLDCAKRAETFQVFCSKCAFPLSKPGMKCPKCDRTLCPGAGRVYGIYRYSGPIRDIILSIKFKYNIRSAIAFHTTFLWPDFSGVYDAVFCVPSHFLRRFSRFFHPAEILAASAALKLGVKEDKGLFRKKYTHFQHSLSGSERSDNVKDVFTYGGPSYKKVLLIDDILTTGSTLESCAAALKKAGVKKVDYLVYAISCD